MISTLTIFVGGIFYIFLHAISFDEAGDWYEVVNTMQYHYSISSEYWLIGLIVLLGFASYFLLLFVKAEKLPPLVSVIAICMVILLNVIQIVYAFQLSKNVNDLAYLLYVYHANILILSARVIHRQMKEQIGLFQSRFCVLCYETIGVDILSFSLFV